MHTEDAYSQNGTKAVQGGWHGKGHWGIVRMAMVAVLGWGLSACSVSVPDGRQALSTVTDATQPTAVEGKKAPVPVPVRQAVSADAADEARVREETALAPAVPQYSPLVQAALAQARLQSDRTLSIPSDLEPPARSTVSHLGLRSVEQEERTRTPSSSAARAASKVTAKASAAQALRSDLLQTGRASWYGDKFHGRMTANGERYNMNAMTAAHKTLPFGTQVCVRSLVSGHEVLVRINDRGPYAGNRIIDVSRGAAEKLGMIRLGLKEVALWIPSEEGGECGDGRVEIAGLRTKKSR